MPIVLHRIDDRLIHGQVVCGWGQPLDVGLVVLVDDDVAASDWEQDLYRMGVPEEMDVRFLPVDAAVAALDALEADPRPVIVLTGRVETMRRLVAGAGGRIKAVNVGGLHHTAGRHQHLRYVFLDDADTEGLRAIEALGATVTAQDLPATPPVPLPGLLAAHE